MIRPPGFRGAAFTTAREGDMESGHRWLVSRTLAIPEEWATADQVHGTEVLDVDRPGPAGRGDALTTSTIDLPLAVFTADCGAVILESESAVAVVHAGWRGAAAGVVARAARFLAPDGGVRRAALGPTIGPCCFEVGEEVAAVFPAHIATTDWGATSVDLPGAIQAQIPNVDWWSADACTRCGEGWFSYRNDATSSRLAALGWRTA